MPGMIRSPITFSVRKIQANAVSPKTRSVHFSPRLIEPSACKRSWITSRPCSIFFGMFRYGQDVSQNQEIGRKITASGMPNFIQAKKSTGGASGKMVPNCAMKIPLGGVPMMVAIPPMVAAWAMEITRHSEKSRCSRVI